jgi:hypothetical protein
MGLALIVSNYVAWLAYFIVRHKITYSIMKR